MKTSFFIALLPALAIACAAPQDEGASSEAAVISGGLPVEASRDFHLAGYNDTTNLHLDADGTFVWNIEGCDYEAAECGTWRKDSSGRIVLSKGGADFRWMNDEWFGGTTKQLTVHDFTDGSIRIGGVVDGKPLTQVWAKGVECIQCFGDVPAVCAKASSDICK